MKYSLLMIDFDGTICDTQPAILHALTTVAGKYCESMPDRETMLKISTGGLPLNQSMYSLIQNGSEKIISEAVDFYRATYSETSHKNETLFPEVKETLVELKRQGVTSIVVSNKVNSLIELSMKRFGISDLIANIYGVVPDRKAKPHSDVFDISISKDYSDIPTDKILMVGDTIIDQTFAANANVAFCFAEHGYGTTDSSLPVQHRVNKFSELLKLV